jgi:uncharacterized protein (TIGR02284 family)
METEKTEKIEELNKLVIINNDRIVGYEKAASETQDSALKQLFAKCAEQSRKFNSELGNQILNQGGKVKNETTTSGKFYRAWMDIKAAITAKDKHAILASCEFGEDVARDTYKSLLNDNQLSGELRNIVTRQYNELNPIHDEIKSLRDNT